MATEKVQGERSRRRRSGRESRGAEKARERMCDGESRSRPGVHLVARSRRVVRDPQFTRPQARVAPTRNDSLYFAFGVG